MQHVITSTSPLGSSRMVSDIKGRTTNNTAEKKKLEVVSSMQQLKNNSTTTGITTSTTKLSTTSDRKSPHDLYDGDSKNSGDVKRKQNMVTSPVERNSKQPTHETYHIEEML